MHLESLPSLLTESSKNNIISFKLASAPVGDDRLEVGEEDEENISISSQSASFKSS
jgi:hypothetical protein